MNNWAIPRGEIVDRAIVAVRRGYYDNAHDAAESMVRLHYLGKSPQHAEGILRRDLVQIYYERHGGQNERRERISRMGRELQAEGWRFIPGHDGRGGFWRHHASRSEVNNNGGCFSSWEAATERAYSSATRQWLIEAV
jgi:hypothetical protein